MSDQHGEFRSLIYGQRCLRQRSGEVSDLVLPSLSDRARVVTPPCLLPRCDVTPRHKRHNRTRRTNPFAILRGIHGIFVVIATRQSRQWPPLAKLPFRKADLPRLVIPKMASAFCAFEGAFRQNETFPQGRECQTRSERRRPGSLVCWGLLWGKPRIIDPPSSVSRS